MTHQNQLRHRILLLTCDARGARQPCCRVGDGAYDLRMPLPLRPELLARIPLLRPLDDSGRARLLAAPGTRTVSFAPMQDIVREGEYADALYVILEGMVEVRIAGVDGREVAIASLRAGEFFGEQGLMSGDAGRRNATVRAVSPTLVLRLERKSVSEALAEAPTDFPLIGGVEGLEETTASSIRDTLRSSRLFRSLPEGEMLRVEAASRVLQPEAGEILVREGAPGDCLFIIMAGTVEIFVLDEMGKPVRLATLHEGNYFGEQALLPKGSGRRNANARAGDGCRLLRIDAEVLTEILERDQRLVQALRLVGEAQLKKITSLRSSDEW
jgi:CRP-like cAMP-binding protein